MDNLNQVLRLAAASQPTGVGNKQSASMTISMQADKTNKVSCDLKDLPHDDWVIFFPFIALRTDPKFMMSTKNATYGGGYALNQNGAPSSHATGVATAVGEKELENVLEKKFCVTMLIFTCHCSSSPTRDVNLAGIALQYRNSLSAGVEVASVGTDHVVRFCRWPTVKLRRIRELHLTQGGAGIGKPPQDFACLTKA